jgi:twitching motility protein PilT
VERVIDLFPHNERFLIQMRLASLLDAVICQTLVPRSDGSGRIAAVEIMQVSPAIRNLIREGRLSQLGDAVRDYGRGGNVTLDEALFKLYWDNVITKETALKYSHDPEQIGKLTSDTLTRNKSPDDKT